MGFDLMYIAAALPAIIIALALHEYGHAAMATKMGDPTPRMQGRLTLNPIAHLDPMGTVFILITLFMGFGFGWGKPVQTNPSYFTDYRKGRILVAIAGPAMNLCLMLMAIGVSFIIFKSGAPLPSFVHMMLAVFVMINLVLMVFNLLPIPPLDGGHVLEMMLPWDLRAKFQSYAQFGFLILIGLMMFRVLGVIINFFVGILLNLVSIGFGADFAYFLVAPFIPE